MGTRNSPIFPYFRLFSCNLAKYVSAALFSISSPHAVLSKYPAVDKIGGHSRGVHAIVKHMNKNTLVALFWLVVVVVTTSYSAIRLWQIFSPCLSYGGHY